MTRLFACCLLLIALAAFAETPKADPARLAPDVQIQRLVVNSFWQTNCFILYGKSREAIVIDPGDELAFLGGDHYRATGTDAQRIVDALKANKLKLKYIILSHGHLDHIGAIGVLKQLYNATIMMHGGDVRPKGDPFEGCPKDTRMFETKLPKVDQILKEGDLITLKDMSLQVIHTPGHSPGGICLRTTQNGRTILFSGDILLYHTVGRTNFRDGSGDQVLEFKMIREKIFTLPDDTMVLPGHYEFTTVGEEKKNNPFLNPPPAPIPTTE